jgi:hypothetical protein
MRARSACYLVAACLAFVAIGSARAENADALKKAQAAFDQAQLDYLQGKYDEAAKEFQDAYAARPFPQFLYNVGASFHMKGKKSGDAAAYVKAVEFYKRYLTEEPQATDKPKVEKAIGVLEAEIKRLKEPAQPNTPKNDDVQQLGDVKVRGLVVVESEPQNASIYLDDKKKGEFAKTPWSGSLDGEHRIIIEKRGYKVAESVIAADPSKLFVLRAVMSEESYLGWVEITSNVPGADIFIDDKTVGAIGKTPLSQNIKPGKHTFWISAEGYDEYSETVDIAAGETHAVKGTLKGTPVGRLNVMGMGIEDATILVDGKVLCERGPCVKNIPQGDHTVTVLRQGYKTYSKTIGIEPKTETSVKVGLAQKPGRGDAVTAYVFTALFVGGGIALGLQANNLHDQIKKEIDAGMPPPDSSDPRFQKGKIFAIAADASFGIAVITGISALVYTFRDKGPASTAAIDRHVLALQPQLGPRYAGLGMEVPW